MAVAVVITALWIFFLVLYKSIYLSDIDCKKASLFFVRIKSMNLSVAGHTFFPAEVRIKFFFVSLLITGLSSAAFNSWVISKVPANTFISSYTFSVDLVSSANRSNAVAYLVAINPEFIDYL
ncbi:hypothetical protein SDC9_192513 [bioreactor metagenome]|uniref:Uncharacterized protein n=1 Tax=bioreactor metagenome TaxID=1076179 RepID=A0A645I273_9ZZZZ